MRKTITIAAYNRPDHLRLLLDSLRAQLLPLNGYGVIISVDAGGDKFDEVMDVARTIDFAPFQLYHTPNNWGTNHNTYWLMWFVFNILGTEWNVYLEDDLVLSPDAFNLVKWYIKHAEELRSYEGIEDIGAYCLCRLWENGSPEKVYLSRAFTGWGFVMDQHQWRTYARPVWRNNGRTWDTSLADTIRAAGPSICNAFPELSRVTNTGRDGSRVMGKTWDTVMSGHVYNESREVYPFRLVGIRS